MSVFRKTAVLLVALSAIAPSLAVASTLSLEATYLNLRLSGSSASATSNMPGLQLRFRQDLGNKWSDSLTLAGSKGQGNTYISTGFSVGKAFALGPVWLRPQVKLQSNWFRSTGVAFRTANAGLSLHAYYPITTDLSAFASLNAGETFGGKLTLNLGNGDQSNLGVKNGITYGGSAGLDYAVGPGVASLGYHYQHVPFGSGINLTTGQAEVGYRISF